MLIKCARIKYASIYAAFNGEIGHDPSRPSQTLTDPSNSIVFASKLFFTDEKHHHCTSELNFDPPQASFKIKKKKFCPSNWPVWGVGGEGCNLKLIAISNCELQSWTWVL